MDPRTQLIAYVEDLAKRNADIAHSAANKRFFLELDYNVLMGQKQQPDNQGWNLVMMGFESAANDNFHGRRVERVSLILDVLKHVGKGVDEVALHALYTTAREIGEELLARFEEHTKNPCNAAVTAGIIVPYSLRLDTKKTIEVGPRWDNFHGYRFSVDVLMDAYVMKASDPAKWITPA